MTAVDPLLRKRPRTLTCRKMGWKNGCYRRVVEPSFSVYVAGCVWGGLFEIGLCCAAFVWLGKMG